MLVLLGWLAGWIIKRILIQFSMILRVDRFLKQSPFEAEITKADVRYSLYHLIGNIGFVIIFLIFFENALVAWKLTILSDLLIKGILLLPRIITALVIFGLGWFLASLVQISVLNILNREEIPRASLISKFTKSLLLIFFSAIAFVELDFAREIIIIGFATIFITLGVIAIVITAINAKDFIRRIGNSLKEEKDEDEK